MHMSVVAEANDPQAEDSEEAEASLTCRDTSYDAADLSPVMSVYVKAFIT